jgi:hypothetical protein
MKNNVVACLEKTFSFWEDLSLIFEAKSHWVNANNKKITEKESLFPKNWRMCRQYILESNLDKISNNFIPKVSEIELSQYEDFGSDLSSFPLDLAMWSGSSRRVFEVSSDLELLLKNTSTGDVKWLDIELPFASFVIKLNKGFLITNPVKTTLRSFLVSQFYFNEERYIRISCFNDEAVDEYKPLSPLKKSTILNASKKGKSGYGDSFFSSLEDGRCILLGSFPLSRNSFDKKKVKESLTELINPDGDISLVIGDELLPLVAGLCLYLKTLTPVQIEKYVIRKDVVTKVSNPRCITNGADICTVQSMFSINDTERVIFRNMADNAKSHEKSPHFRMGSWRRKPGNGDDPDAPKCVWVRPTIVRADRLPEGCLPLGAQTSVCC